MRLGELNDIAYERHVAGPYKYRLARHLCVRLPLELLGDRRGMPPLRTPKFGKQFASLVYGVLHVEDGYAWDGVPTPGLKSDTFMRASVAQDVFYQFMREGILDRKIWKPIADYVLLELCSREMPSWQASYAYWTARLIGTPYTLPRSMP